jgi:UDP-glucose:(heptosyl)LPS alpha-1,3-glucosyltransferase
MERAFAELIRRTHERYDLVVVSSDLGDDLKPLVEWQRVPLPRRPAALRFGVFYVLAAVRLARARAEIAHTLGAIVPNAVSLASVHFSNAGYVDSVGGLAPPRAPALRRMNTGLARLVGLLAERWSYRRGRVEWLAPVSPGLARELVRDYPGIPVCVVPNGVDPSRFQSDAAARIEVRAELDVADDEVIVLFVGGDWHGKGLAVALEAVAAAPAPLRLVVVGRGDEQFFRARARELGIAGCVTFTGPRRDTERIYAAADIFVLPSLYETFSLAAFEAASSGLPIVAPRLNGVEDLIGDDEGGIVVERTPAAIGRALELLATEPASRQRLGDTARSRAQVYTWEQSARILDELYAAVSPRRAA